MEFGKAIGVISAINECVNFFQWARSAVSSLCSRWSGSQEQDINDHVLQLQSGLQRLNDTLPAMYNLIDRAEWKCHEDSVAKLVPKLKDAVYDADDLLDEFRWYEIRVELEGNVIESPLIFFHTFIKESFNKLNYVQERLDHLSSEAEKMGLREVGQRFDRSVRPVTSSMKLEEKIYGRENELEQVMGFLRVPKNLKRKRAGSSVNASTNTSPRNQVCNEPRVPNLPVLPIVGIGGVGKTTLVQHICSHKQVKSQFELIIWVCVSDDFDVKRLTKEVIESCPGKMASTDNLDSLQRALSSHVSNKRLLIVLDDMWGDALKENGQCWKRFCAPLKSTKKGSMMLVTTRCPRVAEGVGTVDPIILQGLKYDAFWSFFKLCVFGSESSSNDHKLECIGRSILPKLKGSPLAAKTLGRMLRMDLQASHWNTILESELWELKQTETDILPALRLSYMYLPFYLKRCFAFCAVYPKGYRFQKEDLAEIWVAEGFVESQGDNSLQQTGCQYFEDLVARSFFQEVSGHRYVIPDLLHDMAQKVSEHDCFILRDKNDLDKVPQYVRHIYILPNSNIVNANLLSLCKHTKLRTIICKKQLRSKTSCVMDNWCTKLLRVRVISCASTNELPDSIGNLKHLRYLKISEDCPLSIPSTFCWLYNLQILDVKTCKIECLPRDFSNLSNLRRFISKGFSYSLDFTYLDAADIQVQGTRLIKNLNQIRGRLDIGEVCMLSEDHAAEAELKNKKYLHTLALDWSWRYSQLSPNHHESQIMQHNATKVIQVLQPPITLRSLFLLKYPGVSLPSWFQPQNLPSLTSLEFRSCGLDSISFSMISQNINFNEIPSVLVDNNNDSIGIFLSLTELTIYRCQSLSSLEQFLLPDCVPAIKKISVEICESLSSVPTERFKNFRYLEYLFISLCPNLNWQRGLALPSSLQSLELDQCGDFSASVPKCLENLTSLVSLKIVGCQQITSIPAKIWGDNLALLEELLIRDFPDLVSIGGAKAVAKIKKVVILDCPKLMEADQIMRRTKLTLVSLPAFTPLLSRISERKSLT